MPCFYPIPAERDGLAVKLHPKSPGTAGIRGAWTSVSNLSLPCGACLGCKISRGQEWASRAVHELREHHSAVFATLTYDEEHLPYSRSLEPSVLSDFIKRLRAEVSRAWSKDWLNVNGPEYFYAGQLRYIACGEYGDLNGRPHYHAILFGVSFNDAARATAKLFHSPELERTWGFGTVNYGEVTRASAAYVAGYTAKSLGRSHCDADGVVLEPPFLRVSKGIGRRYVERYAEDFRSGGMIVDGTPHKIPRYYRKRLAAVRPDIYAEAQFHGQLRERGDSGFPDRLVAGEVIARRRRELTRSHSL